MKLRDYQHNCVEAILREFEQVNSTLVVMPTSSGKTVMFAHVIKRFLPKKCLVLAHREELIFQAAEKIHAVTGEQPEIEMADFKAFTGEMFDRANVVVSTVQTQCSGERIKKFDPHEFSLVIVDECHRGVSDTHRRVMDYYRQNPECKFLGVTATPDRSDEEALGQVFDTVAFDYEILDAIHDGWVVPLEQQMVGVSGLDYSQIRTTAGDLNGADLARVLEDERNLHGMATPTIEIIGQRRSVMFTESVVQAERMAEIFNRHRPGMAAWVCGKTPKDDRRNILSRFNGGETQMIVNCGVLSEGWDSPGVQVVVMGRPTKSRSLYAQQIGRGLRPLPGTVDGIATAEERRAAIAASPKPSALILDFVGNSGKHKLVTTSDILGGQVSDEAIEAAKLRAVRSNKPVRIAEMLEEEQQRIERAKQRAAAERNRLIVGARYQTRSINPFDILDIRPAKIRGWHADKHLSEKQCALLAKQGINPDSINYAEGRQLIAEMFRRWNGKLCSFGQAKVLKRYGYSVECSRDEASKILDGLAKNGWRKAA